MFAFYGREQNIRIQWPFIQRILGEHPNVRFDVWDLCHYGTDRSYVRALTGDRVTVRTDFSHLPADEAFGEVWRWYANNGDQAATYIKVDDDVLFLETEMFDSFITAIEDNPETVMSANTINNGACTWLEPLIWRGFEQLGIDLLDVHCSSEYAELAHRHFHGWWPDMLKQSPQVIPTEDWLSINCIGMNHQTLCALAEPIGTPTPACVAGWWWPTDFLTNDERAANMLPRAIYRGFLAAHLSFGPQDLPPSRWDQIRDRYRTVMRDYLA